MRNPNTAPEPSYSYNNEQSTEELSLPTSFEEARHIGGKSIEDMVADIGNLDDIGLLRDPLNDKTNMVFQQRDRDFFEAGGILKLQGDMADFRDQLIAENPHQAERSAAKSSDPWLHLGSKAFIEGRVNGNHDNATARIYLNPDKASLMGIYKEVFTRAEAAGLRFQSKTTDYPNSFPGWSDKEVAEGMKRMVSNGKQGDRAEQVVFYGFDESKDDLLKIVGEVYAEHAEAFEGRRTGNIALEVAPGFAVGDEPAGLSGKESLTSHRQKFFRDAYGELSKYEKFNSLNDDKKRAVYLQTLRTNAPKFGIDPDNIAFNYQEQSTPKANNPETADLDLSSIRESQPERTGVMIEGDDGQPQEWRVSHTDNESGVVYLKHVYGDEDKGEVQYRGMSPDRLAELQATAQPAPNESTPEAAPSTVQQDAARAMRANQARADVHEAVQPQAPAASESNHIRSAEAPVESTPVADETVAPVGTAKGWRARVGQKIRRRTKQEKIDRDTAVLARAQQIADEAGVAVTMKKPSRFARVGFGTSEARIWDKAKKDVRKARRRP